MPKRRFVYEVYLLTFWEIIPMFLYNDFRTWNHRNCCGTLLSKVFRYIAKPLDLNRCFHTVRKCLDKKGIVEETKQGFGKNAVTPTKLRHMLIRAHVTLVVARAEFK